MSARVVTSTPVLTPRGSVARGRSNGSVSRVVVVGGEGSLSRVVVARARADGKMNAEETTKTTTNVKTKRNRTTECEEEEDESDVY